MAYKFPSLWHQLVILLILLASCTTAPAATKEPTAAQVPATETLPQFAERLRAPLGASWQEFNVSEDPLTVVAAIVDMKIGIGRK